MVAAGLVAGVPGYPLLLATAPLLGLLGGWSHVVAPLALRAYSGNEDLAAAESQSSIATGFAWVIGGLAGAALVTQVGPPTAFVADFALTVPLVLVVLLVEPGRRSGPCGSSPRPWRDLLGRLRHNPAVSRSAVIGLASAIFISPFASMVVPIARDLQHTLAIHAGLILACIAVGEMLSPAAVRSMSRVGSRVSPTWVAYTIAGLVLIVIGLTVLAFDGGPELVAVAAFGIVYGAVNYGGSSFLIRDAAAESDDANRQADLAAFFLAVGIGVPIGTLLWGQIVHLLSAAHVLMFAGLGMVAFVGALGSYGRSTATTITATTCRNTAPECPDRTASCAAWASDPDGSLSPARGPSPVGPASLTPERPRQHVAPVQNLLPGDQSRSQRRVEVPVLLPLGQQQHDLGAGERGARSGS